MTRPNQKSRAQRQPERRPDLREVRARKARLGIASARRARRRPGAGCSASTPAREVEGFPEVSEIEVIRHFTRLSTWNYAIDLGMYPLGSCTMKYNPRVNEFVARLDGIATEHPYQPRNFRRAA